MMKKSLSWIIQLSKNAVFQTTVGFLGFLVIAAAIMLTVESSALNSGINSFFQSLWFSIVTVTTVGYGDLSPLTALGKIAAVVIMIIGIIYVGVLTGNITSWLVERNRKRVHGLVPIKELQGHILICGWKQGMNELVKEVLNLHNRQASEVVLVNDVNAQDVNELRQDPKLRDFHYFSGDYSNNEVLINSCADKAEKALILADEHSGKTADEIDFKTVLSTIAIKRLRPEVFTIVEIIDTRFRHYLQNVEAEEVILNRFYARALICNTALMSGINSTFKSFFSMGSGILKIRKLDESNIGKLFGELREEHDNELVIGVLENTGNLRHRKHEKMLQIQKSVTIKDAINGLIEIKKMESNIPVLYPSPYHKIKENSALIILNTKPHGLNKKHPKEIELETFISQNTPYTVLLKQIEKFTKRSETWDDFVELLGKLNITTYRYQGAVEGVIYEDQKISLETLGATKELIDDVNELSKKRRKIEVFIGEAINSFLEISNTWEEFYENLANIQMTVYQYRRKPFGIDYQGKKYSFKNLNLPSELIEQLEKHEQMQSQVRGISVDPKTTIDTKYLSLSEFLTQFQKKSISLSLKGSGQKGILMICGWKPQLIEMLDFIILQYQQHHVEWHKVVVVADVDAETKQLFLSHYENSQGISLVVGDFVDQKVLRKAGILQAKKVIILAETDSGKTLEEIDAQTVLAAMLIGSMNKHVYKVAEILDKRYKDALNQANVEEIFLEDEFTRIMLANGSHGLGLTKVLGELINLDRISIEILEIEAKFIHQSFADLYKDTYQPGKLVLGLLEDTGNIYARKSEKIYQAQIQSNIQGQVEELIKVKSLVPNNIIVAPEKDYRINPNSKLIILSSNHKESWDMYLELTSI